MGDTLRLIFACTLGEGGAVGNCHPGPETADMVKFCRFLGADIEFDDNVADILSEGQPQPHFRMAPSTALVARYAASLALQYDTEIAIVSPPLPKRAISHLSIIASTMGSVALSPQQGTLKVRGPLSGPGMLMGGIEGAYWISPLAIASALPMDEAIFQLDDFSAMQPPFRQTLSVFDAFDVIYSLDEPQGLFIVPGDQIFPQRLLDAQGDWRNASYLIGALVAAGAGSVKGVSSASLQNERLAWKAAEESGLISFSEDGETVKVKAAALPSLPIDPRSAPALIPLWMSLALYANTPISIGPLAPLSPLAQRRIGILTDIFQTLGAQVENLEESLIIHPSKLRGGAVDAKGDTRVAMALAIAALGSSEPITINNAEGVAKIFPEFWAQLRSMGADITLPIIGKHVSDKTMLP